MPAAPENHRPDPFAGYYASIALALVTSGWLAGHLVSLLGAVEFLVISKTWQMDIGAGLFLGIAFSNIVGVVFYRQPLRRALFRFVIGGVLGSSIQSIVFTPLAGHGMSNFLFLLLAGGVVPIVLTIDQINASLRGRGINLRATFGLLALKTLQLPNRALFVGLMALSLVLFWFYTQSAVQVFLVLLVFLLLLTLSVSRRAFEGEMSHNPIDAEHRAWLELDPEDLCELSIGEEILARLKLVGQSLLPGAVLFGGMIMLALYYLSHMYPDMLSISAKTMGVAAASGLAVVFFGMLAALGFGLAMLQIIGRMQNWSVLHLREKCLFLIRVMYFRPLRDMDNTAST